ncbi:hypothetical protein [Psychromonas sp.]|uniref:hypothetical protein n=1 Tax=Psychromonas sp. TaxID=1884585 RepID=UPI003561534C
MSIKNNILGIIIVLSLTGCNETLLDTNPNKALEYSDRIFSVYRQRIEVSTKKMEMQTDTELFKQYERNKMPTLMTKYNHDFNEISARNNNERQRVLDENRRLLDEHNTKIAAETERLSLQYQKEMTQYELEVSKIKNRQAQHKQDLFNEDLEILAEWVMAMHERLKQRGWKPPYTKSWEVKIMQHLDNASQHPEKFLKMLQSCEKEMPFSDPYMECSHYKTDARTNSSLTWPQIHPQKNYQVEQDYVYPTRPKRIMKVSIAEPMTAKYIPEVLPTKPVNPYKDYTGDIQRVNEKLAKLEAQYQRLVTISDKNDLSVDWDGFFKAIRSDEQATVFLNDNRLASDYLLGAMKEHLK